MYNCKFCNSQTRNKQYCGPKCQGAHVSQTILSEWKSGEDSGLKKGYRLKTVVRKYILNKYNNCCSKCSWKEINPITGTSPLEIDHIDGDCSNAKEENLRVLCPNCHSLTPTWKALNKGKGLRNRHIYSGLTVDHS